MRRRPGALRPAWREPTQSDEGAGETASCRGRRPRVASPHEPKSPTAATAGLRRGADPRGPRLGRDVGRRHRGRAGTGHHALRRRLRRGSWPSAASSTSSRRSSSGIRAPSPTWPSGPGQASGATRRRCGPASRPARDLCPSHVRAPRRTAHGRAPGRRRGACSARTQADARHGPARRRAGQLGHQLLHRLANPPRRIRPKRRLQLRANRSRARSSPTAPSCINSSRPTPEAPR